MSLPLAPGTPVATRISDAQVNLTWANNGTYTGIAIYRQDNQASDQIIAVLAGSATSYSDTGASADRKLDYIVTAINADGATNSPASNFIYTTPAAPTTCRVVRTGTDLVVTWTNLTSYSASAVLEVWHAANGVWDGAALTTTAAGAVTYTHASAGTVTTHTYRVRAKSPTTIYSSYAVSNVAGLPTRPGIPVTRTDPSSSHMANYDTVDAAYATTLMWTHQPSVDTSYQTAYEVQYQVSTDGGATWGAFVFTGKLTSSTNAHVYTANTWVNNRMVRWQVRTWGYYTGAIPTYSDWGTLVTIYTNAIPVAALTGGTTGVSSVLTVPGSYLDPEGTAQVAARWTLRTTGGATLETITLSNTDAAHFLTYTFTTPVANGTSYVVAYQVQDTTGHWSLEVTKTIAITYTRPPTPTLAATFQDGSVSGTITNPTRTNLCTNSNAEINTAGWLAENGAGLTRDTVSPISGTASFQLSGGDVYFTTGAVVAGETYTFSLDYTTAGTVTGSPMLTILLDTWGDTASMVLPLTQTTPGRFSVTATAPVNKATGLFFVFSPIGVIHFDNVQIEKNAPDTTYFPGTLPAAVYNVIYRDGVAIPALSGVAINGSFTDPLPPLDHDVSYTVVAVSALPSVSLPSDAQVVSTSSNGAVWLNSGPGMGMTAPVSKAPKLSATRGREKVLVQYDGPEDPTQYSGMAKTVGLDLTGLATAAELDALEALVERPEPGCYRDSHGRKIFVSLLSIKYNDGAGSAILKAFTISMKRTSYSE